MTEITYIVNHPVKLSDHFEIPMDQSKWDGTSYEEKGTDTVPVRDRIIHFKNLLIPKTNYGMSGGVVYAIPEDIMNGVILSDIYFNRGNRWFSD